MKLPIHGSNDSEQGGEFTLCGLAFDAYQSGDHDEEIVFACPGEIVTCKECRRQIDAIKRFKRYRQP